MYKRKLICCTFFVSRGGEVDFTRKRKWKAEIRVNSEKLAGALKKW